MKKTLLLLFFFCSSIMQAQNLVPNPSFELYTICPNYQGQVNRLLNWFTPNQGDPDFLASCATNNMVAVPQNFVGTQNPKTGNNYAGIGVFPWTGGGLYPMICEYLQVQLTEPLIINKTYYVSFYVSLADSSEYYSQSIAASFGDTAIHVNYSYPLYLPPHIIANHPLNDTSSWQKIEGYYHAHGGEKYLTIGYFNNDTTSIDTIKFQNILPGGICDTGAYYYLDDVLVTDSLFLSVPEQNSFNNTSYNYILNQQNNFTFYSEEFDKNNVQIEIVDLLGNIVMKKMGFNSNICKCIDLNYLQSGPFIYRINNKNEIKQQGILLIIKN